MVLALLGLVPVANLMTGGREVPWWTGAMLIWGAYGSLLIVVVWAAANRWGAALDRLAARTADAVMRPSELAFVISVGAMTTVLGAAVALYCYSGRGFTGDEMAMTWHARMLVAGHLTIPVPAHPEFFNTVSVLQHEGRWFSQYPIGGPALLALGLAARVVWLVNPLLLGIAAWQLHRFVRHAFGEGTARATALLFMLSPFVLVLGATQMNHTAAMTLVLIALAQLAAWDTATSHTRALHAAGLGVAVAAVALVRPLDAALLALPVGLFQLARLRRRPERRASLVVQVVAGALPVVLLLWANARTTGAPLLFAYDAAHGPAHGLGFHVDPNGEAHTIWRGIVYASGYLMRFDRFLMEWPLPALLLVCVVLASLRQGTRWDTMLLALFGSFVVGYGAYWHNGFFDGPRFLLPVAPVLLLYLARTPEAAARIAHAARRRTARLIVPACVLCAWLVPLPFSSVPGRLMAQREQRTKLKTDVAAQASAAGLTRAVVFVREPWRGRLLARLRGMGVPQFEAERVVNSTDACALQTALDDAGGNRWSDTRVRRDAVVQRARSAGVALLRSDATAESRVARAPAGPDTPQCRAEQAADAFGTMPYAMFLREQEVARDGRLAGAVVWARDLGPRNVLLREEFGDRRWYLYKPGQSLDDTAEFLPLAP